MNKVYILTPILALAIFFGYYWNFNKSYEADKAAKAAVIQKEKKAAAEKENADRMKAMEQARIQQEIRKKEKAEKEEADRKQKEERQAASDAREKAYRDQEKMAKQVDRLSKEIEAEKLAVTKIEENKKIAQDEKVFLDKFIKEAEANEKAVRSLIEKINAADVAREKAAEAAAKEAAAKAKQ